MVCNLYTIWRWSNCFKILWNRNLWIQMFVYLDFNNNTSRQIRGVTPGSECSFGLLDFRMNANLGWRAWDSAGRLSITRVTIENHQSNNWCRKKTGCISISPQTTQTTINNNQQSTSIARVTSGAEKNRSHISISPQTTALTENKKEESCNIILRHTLHSSKWPVSTPVCMSLWKMAKCVNSLHWTWAEFLLKHWMHYKSKGRQMLQSCQQLLSIVYL